MPSTIRSIYATPPQLLNIKCSDGGAMATGPWTKRRLHKPCWIPRRNQELTSVGGCTGQFRREGQDHFGPADYLRRTVRGTHRPASPRNVQPKLDVLGIYFHAESRCIGHAGCTSVQAAGKFGRAMRRELILCYTPGYISALHHKQQHHAERWTRTPHRTDRWTVTTARRQVMVS